MQVFCTECGKKIEIKEPIKDNEKVVCENCAITLASKHHFLCFVCKK
jgi:DNA-directed RNA polymerase subunit RPC12/RpoP